MTYEAAVKLKLELRSWESAFLKENSRKPTREDIAKDNSINQTYDEFVRLKKKIGQKSNCSKSQNEFLKAKKENVQPIWGENLLKKNSNHLIETIEKITALKKSPDTSKNPLPSWRAALRKNISKSTLKQRRLAGIDKEVSTNTQKSTDQKHFIGNDLKNNQEEDLNLSLCNTSLPIISNTQGNSLPLAFLTPGVKKSFSKGSFLNRSVEINWMKNDLVNDENITFKDENEASVNVSSFSLKDFQSKLSTPKTTINYQTDFTEFKETQTIEKCSETENYSEQHESNPKEKALKIEDTPISYNDICLDEEDNVKIVDRKDGDETFDNKINGNQKPPHDTENTFNSSQSSGVVSNNFVRVNMKKKVYKGKGSSGQFLRKQVLRKKMQAKGLSFKSGWKGRNGGGSFVGNGRPVNVGLRDMKNEKCFKCGETGHWSSKCPNRFGKRKEKEPETQETLDDVLASIEVETGLNPLIPQEAASYLSQQIYDKQVAVATSESLEELALDEPNHPEILKTLKMFGYESFRPGQYKAISRILKGQPTLLVLATGSGKSLCYQLPAYLYATKRNAITIVISPLVSLMDDQVLGLPKMLKAVRLHSGMTKVQKSKVMELLESGKVHVLLLSPEALTTWAGMSMQYSPLSKLPPVAFVCVDECHCLSEWSHSFRPSYLRVCKVLIDQLGVKCMVGLTATATMDTCIGVAKQLGIHDMKQGIVAKIDIPPNLVLTVSRDKYKDQSLLHLLRGERFKQLDSIIIYCTRRDECARVSSILRTQLQDMPTLEQDEDNNEEEEQCENNSRKRKRKGSHKKGAKKAVSWDADCYHAGMSTAERRKIQNRFMSGQLRVVVATVAFGMGIDKHDVRSVIHYNSPRSFERYVQEIGRAGRDGKPAHCHLFQDAQGGDLNELSRHTYGKSVDRFTIKKLIRKIFPKCTCNKTEDWDDWSENSTTKTGNVCKGHYAAIPIDQAVEDLDLSREGIETLLCFLELEGYITVHLPTEATCKLDCYGGSRQMMHVAKKCPPVAVALKIAKMKKGGQEWETEVEFCAATVADKMNMKLSSLKKVLRFLMWDTSLSSEGSAVGKSGVSVEFIDLSFFVQTKVSATNEFLDSVTDMLYNRSVAQERKELGQLKMCFETMQQFSYANVGLCCDITNCGKSDELKKVIKTYFQAIQDNNHPSQDVQLSPAEENEIRNTVRHFLQTHGKDIGRKITGRAIARIFQGINSPRYPAANWGPVRTFWRCKLNINFNSIMKIATREIISWFT